ncbi:MAG: bifunctional response regulator/alkaline phosphatase family protein [Ignavibacteriae bacterium]|nr:bifunctional response regulator/alkaline phosphatase family protein [Ignavibacteriota bacterium]
MEESKGRVLWVDDEIDLLRSHVAFLRERGYHVETVTNGEDAVALVRENLYDLVFLDEMMPGMGGLKTLAGIKDLQPAVPVVMITKNEEESLMEEAIGGKISDYLTKPVNPSQVLMACKKFLEGRKITGAALSKDYIKEFNEIALALNTGPDYKEWIDIYTRLVGWGLEFDKHPELGLKQTLSDQMRECNLAFGKYVERNYRDWVEQTGGRPPLSPEIVDRYVLPELQTGRSVVFFVIDCMRLDQWLVFEELLQEYFTIAREYYYSILPTATPYSRNAIFSGSYPCDVELRHPDLWDKNEDDESSRNRYERQFLEKLLERRKVILKPEPKYIKILDPEFGRSIESTISSYTQSRLTSIVVNFVDMLAHGRSDSSLLKEIAPDESAYRSLTRSWFVHSSLFGMLKTLSRHKNVTVILTTDHGSIRSLRGSKVLGDREASTNLRYKYGRNLKCDEKAAIFVKNPHDFKLPNRGVAANYIIAKEDFYFVYPTDYHKYLNQYRDSFQHGGVSMEEMILPVIRMEPRG